jgi:UDP:flavonoid glycosyltransferase YjiC (YdhE family)
MPYCWDGHDNARRAEETGTGVKLDRYRWTDPELAEAITSLAGDAMMRARLKDNGSRMQAAAGAARAASAILETV